MQKHIQSLYPQPILGLFGVRQELFERHLLLSPSLAPPNFFPPTFVYHPAIKSAIDNVGLTHTMFSLCACSSPEYLTFSVQVMPGSYEPSDFQA